MPVTKAQKVESLKELMDKFSRTKTIVYAEYRGLSVKALSSLRGKLRKEGSEFKVAKKTLINLAAKQNSFPEVPDDFSKGPMGAIFSYEDELAGIRIVSTFAKTNENVKVMGAIIDGKLVGADIVKRYAAIPSREVLLSKLLGSMKSPIQGFYSVLHGTLSSFVRVVNAYKDSKPSV